MFYDAIAVGGNFKEFYVRTMNPNVVPLSVLSHPINGTYGVMHSLPFGRLEVDGPAPALDGTLTRITRRGKLRCGIPMNFEGFAEIVSRDNSTGRASRKGMDVDYWRAIATGALGNPDLIEFFEVSTHQEGFVLLHTGEIDVLAGAPWNLENYVREPSTDVGFSFSRPYFYNNSMANTVGR